MPQGIILSLGSINADFQVRVDQPLGSTTTLLGHDYMRLSGGKAANVAYLADRLGAPAAVMAQVGDDALREQALRSLQDTAVDLSGVRTVPDCATAFSVIMVPPDGEKNIVLASNANDAWHNDAQDEVRQTIQDAPDGSVLVVDYEIPPFIVEAAIRAAHQRKLPVILDPARPDRVDHNLLSLIDYIVPDIAETVVHVPAVSVDVVDSTGAGDAFAGALAVAVQEQRPWREAVCFATAAATASTTGYGSQPAYPTRDRIQPLYEQIFPHIRVVDSDG